MPKKNNPGCDCCRPKGCDKCLAAMAEVTGSDNTVSDFDFGRVVALDGSVQWVAHVDQPGGAEWCETNIDLASNNCVLPGGNLCKPVAGTGRRSYVLRCDDATSPARYRLDIVAFFCCEGYWPMTPDNRPVQNLDGGVPAPDAFSVYADIDPINCDPLNLTFTVGGRFGTITITGMLP